MNEEEKKAVEFIRDLITWDVRQYLCPNKEECKNLEIILNLIEKQQKEIQNLQTIDKEHQKLNGELRDEIKRQGNTREIEEKYIEENFISKDKIRKIIKDLEDYMILFTNDKEKFNRYKYARNILEKLLEEE